MKRIKQNLLSELIIEEHSDVHFSITQRDIRGFNEKIFIENAYIPELIKVLTSLTPTTNENNDK